ncbi:hypothetical protein CC86DRAFT_405180 [Ophiobolus disseminans]|uniref:Rhodopsin domain-containing protein n=1 Tax=Ophiobolus disseminans TaxID=1469910 RepID=A0A6A7A670_9PLEO|nr:hypothetical protein CC86DRAFT_405180 [Ophiobolus disseminans]
MARHSDDSVAQSGEQQERITIAFLVLSWFFILLRIWTRTFIISNFGWDDSTMILAGMIFTVYCGALLYIGSNGGGTHIRDIAQLQLLTKWVVVSEATYIMSMMMLKVSLGIFFARIIVKPWQRGIIYANVGLNVFSSAAAFFYCLFRCGSNIEKYVEQQLSKQCTPQSLDRFVAYQQAAFTTLTDVVFIALPVMILWNANMSRQSKFSVGFILCLATLGVICSILRFRYVDGITQTDDFFWNAVNISTWSTIECGASIIAGCLATLRPFLKRLVSTAQNSSVLESCVHHMSRSFRSSKPSDGSSSPQHNSPSTEVRDKGMSMGNQTVCARAREPTFAEFIARPREEVIAVSERDGQSEGIAERIVQAQRDPELEFPWPVKPRDRKRQTIHASWTLSRGVASDGRTAGVDSYERDARIV